MFIQTAQRDIALPTDFFCGVFPLCSKTVIAASATRVFPVALAVLPPLAVPCFCLFFLCVFAVFFWAVCGFTGV